MHAQEARGLAQNVVYNSVIEKIEDRAKNGWLFAPLAQSKVSIFGLNYICYWFLDDDQLSDKDKVRLEADGYKIEYRESCSKEKMKLLTKITKKKTWFGNVKYPEAVKLLDYLNKNPLITVIYWN